ncbi:MAG: FKBP-type peptidyl-prolyl cis-trans isomerase [Thermoplasmata archaeon]
MMNKGDIVRLDYDGWTVGAKPEESELFDTTNEALAREKGIFKEDASYGPVPVIIGGERLVKGLEASLLTAEVGKEVEVVIPPAEAFGERDGRKLEVHSLAEVMRLPEFRKGERELVPGEKIVLNNRKGTIVSVRGGRVRVDYNHELAGKTVKYRYTIRQKLETVEEKIAAILELDYDRPDGFRIQVSGTEATITVKEKCKFDPRWALAKLAVVRDLREYAGITTVRFVEEYIKPTEAAAAPEAGPARPAGEGTSAPSPQKEGGSPEAPGGSAEGAEKSAPAGGGESGPTTEN